MRKDEDRTLTIEASPLKNNLSFPLFTRALRSPISTLIALRVSHCVSRDARHMSRRTRALVVLESKNERRKEMNGSYVTRDTGPENVRESTWRTESAMTMTYFEA